MQKYLYLLIVELFSSYINGQNIPILTHPAISIEKVGVLNTAQRETNLALTDAGNTLFFMSTRGGQLWSRQSHRYKGKMVFDGDIWVAKKDTNHQWQSPQCLGTKINTSSGEDEPTLLTNDRLFLYQSWANWQADGGPYYLQEKTADFDNPKAKLSGYHKGLGGEITRFFKETQNLATDGIAMSPDVNRFLIVCGKDYDSDMDVYISLRKEGEWTYPQKASISSPADERSISFAKDGKTIYFASNAYNGFGGLDIYKADIDKEGKITNVQNIGEPFNTKQDDYGFIVNAAGTEAYFIREEDIYFADLRQADSLIKPKLKLEVKSDTSLKVTLKGNIISKQTGASIPQTTVLLLDAETYEIVAETYTDAAGQYTFIVPNDGKNYLIKVDMFLYESDNQFIKAENLPFSHEYKLNFGLSHSSELRSE